MVQITAGEHMNLKCMWISNGKIKLAVTTERGPRAIFFAWQNGPNLLAELPNAVIDSANGPYYLLGGHRLWHAPEWSVRTYWPETQILKTETGAHGVCVQVPPDGSAIAKELSFEMDTQAAKVVVTHTLRNTGLWTVELAPWAITQCVLGGVVLLPQPDKPSDEEGLLPSQRYSFWPYTKLTDGRIALGDRMTLVHTRPAPPTKLGYFNTHGWIGYWLNGTLFTKHFTPALHAPYPDFGCNAECYQNEAFVELETLGPLTHLPPNASVTHVEIWELRDGIDKPDNEAKALELAQKLGL
ncbi:MAG: hypothetical protein RMN25_13125 [Anaerolineae bacterium]|nr:hypothetical protein [Thermoflexales bacterium]MDW8408715.1 hypothetical protein [Anaerolineae bacterium]